MPALLTPILKTRSNWRPCILDAGVQRRRNCALHERIDAPWPFSVNCHGWLVMLGNGFEPFPLVVGLLPGNCIQQFLSPPQSALVGLSGAVAQPIFRPTELTLTYRVRLDSNAQARLSHITLARLQYCGSSFANLRSELRISFAYPST